MKKILLIAITGLTLVACKKHTAASGTPNNTDTTGRNNIDTTNHNPNDTIPANTITATIGRTNYVYTTDFGGVTDTTYSFFEVSTADTSTNTIDLTFGLPLLSIAHTYSDTAKSGEGAVQIQYYQNGGLHYIDASVKNSPVTLTVDSISSTVIRGRFQGVLYQDGDTTLSQLVLTNGRFNITRK